jgi:ppGpp synthetase/RelA/SpoT-type nucleotidyltranferase
MMLKATVSERRIIDPLLRYFDEKRPIVSHFHGSLLEILSNSENLRPLVHSFRARMKARDHLEDKLLRKLRDTVDKGTEFTVTAENLLTSINDLAGIRILHLHTSQMQHIHEQLLVALKQYELDIIEGPDARTWDDEYRKYFSDLGFKTTSSESMYTSVHYVIGSRTAMKMTCELQVRTLMEEVWGEVDHTLNYPHKSESVPCREQIRALARATSTSTRLVDAIFATVKDEAERSLKISATKKLPEKAKGKIPAGRRPAGIARAKK